MIRVGPQLSPVDEDMALICMQFQGEALGDDLRRPLQMLQASGGIAEEQEEVAIVR